MAPTSAAHREKWSWIPVLFFKARGRSEAPSKADREPAIDANTQSLLRMVAHMLPRCVPEGAGERCELQEISDRLEVLAGGLPEREWAESLANELISGRSEDTTPPIRVCWG